MKKRFKKVTSWILALVMIVSLIQVSSFSTKAAQGEAYINLGELSWQNGHEIYTFPNVEVSFSEGTQKIFCVSVDNGGSFQIGNEAALNALKNSPGTSISGISFDGTKYTYVNELDTTMKLSMVTMICRDNTEGLNGIISFLKGLTFYRNGASEEEVQNVTAIANTVMLPDDMTAIAMDGAIHYYKYVPFETETNLTWFESYKAAKREVFQGLHGYLATVTTMNEQQYIYKYFCSYVDSHQEAGWNYRPMSWIGGARTYLDEVQSELDSAEITNLVPGKLTDNPWDASKKITSEYAQHWYWMCGPEAGLSFYVTNSQGRNVGAQGTQGADIGYDAWNNGEPNNNEWNNEGQLSGTNGPDIYSQEYALEYGYGEEGYWNDYSPYNVDRGCMRGYIIEFSPYSNPPERGGNTETESTPSAKAEIPVSVTDPITIDADGFTITLADTKDLTAAASKLLADVSVKDGQKNISADSSSITVLDTELQEIRQVVRAGKRPLTFIYTDPSNPQRTVKKTVTVTIEETDPHIIAGDILVKKDDVPTTDEDIKGESKPDLTGKDGNNRGEENVGVKDKGMLPELAQKQEPGVTQVTFKDITSDDVPDKAPDKVVTATVVDEVSEPVLTQDESMEVKIGANHYCITVAQAKEWLASGKTSDAMETVFKALSNASATERDVNSSMAARLVGKSNIKIESDTIEAKNGIYKMTFEYRDAKVTVDVTVKDDGVTDNAGTPIAPTQIPSVNLTGNDFSVPAKGTPLDKTSFMDKGDVTAQKTDGSKIPADDITVDSNDLAKVNTAITNGNKGEYPVTVTTNGVKTIVTVTVTDVADDKPYKDTGNNDKKETIAANNFVIGIEDYDKINNNVSNVVTLSNAKAYDTDTKAPVNITKVDTSKVENKQGTYPVTLTTENGTSTTIQVTISNDWKTVGDIDKAGEANKSSDTTKNTTAVPNSNKPNDTVGVDKVYEISNPKDVTQDLDKGRTVDKVTFDGTDLPASQYTVKDDVLTIKSSALAGKKPGTYPVVITYKDGSKKTFNIKVVEYDAQKVITKVPILKMKKNIGVGNKFTLNLVGIDKTAVKQFKSSNKKVATINSKGVITGKKKGKCVITANVIQKGSYYKVRVNLTVKKPMMIYNLKNAALSKKSGELPEFNVYKRIFKGKKTKLKFTSVQKNAKITYTTKNKKIATVTKKGVIKGKKRGFTVVTAKIVQNGKTYVTRIFVRVDDNKTNKQNKKYLKENYGKKKK